MLKKSFCIPFNHKLSVSLSQLITLFLPLSVIVLLMEVLFLSPFLPSSLSLPSFFPLYFLIIIKIIGERCYESGEEQKVVQMGLSEVCEGEITFVKVKLYIFSFYFFQKNTF